MLRAALGPQTAAAFGGGSAGANVGLIESLPDNQKLVAQQAFSDSLSKMWIMYVAFSAVGLLISFLITKNTLSKQHEEMKTGMEEEKRKRVDREAARARRKRESKGDFPEDAEAPPEAPKTGEKATEKF